MCVYLTGMSDIHMASTLVWWNASNGLIVGNGYNDYSHQSNDAEKFFQSMPTTSLSMSLFLRAAASSLRARAERAKLLIVGFGDTVTHLCPMLPQKDKTGWYFRPHYWRENGWIPSHARSGPAGCWKDWPQLVQWLVQAVLPASRWCRATACEFTQLRRRRGPNVEALIGRGRTRTWLGLRASAETNVNLHTTLAGLQRVAQGVAQPGSPPRLTSASG